MRKVRATAMIHTLALISLVLLVAFALAASSLSQLNLSARYSQRTQSDYTARAAMTEFVIKAQQRTGALNVTEPPASILPKFALNEVLLADNARINGRVTLLRDRCIDNSGSSLPARSNFDPPGKTSVPPYCLSIVYEVMIGSRRYIYESLIQQRWPYALTAPGPIIIPGRIGPAPDGTPDPTSMPSRFWSAPSEVKGRILALETDITEDVDSHRTGESLLGQQLFPVKVSTRAYEALYPYAYSGGLKSITAGSGLTSIQAIRQNPDDRLVLGGLYKFLQLGAYVAPSKRAEAPGALVAGLAQGGASLQNPGTFGYTLADVTTKGALVKRGVDLVQNQPPGGQGVSTQEKVTVHEGNFLQGRSRYDYRLNGANPAEAPSRERMRKLFAKPDTSQWQQQQIPPRQEIIIGSQAAPQGLALTSIYVQAPSGRIRHHGNLYPAGFDLDSSAGAEFLQNQATALGLPAGYPLQGSLSLQDVSLAVEGDLSLTNYVLKGSRATLIVDGTLTLDGGYLDAGDNGLVIFCRRLIMKAQGNFNGLIVAEKGAAIYGSGASQPPSEPGLTIKGGLLVGGTDLVVIGKPTLELENLAFLNMFLPLQMRGLMLSSCKLEYAPQYMRGLNSFGNYEVLATTIHP